MLIRVLIPATLVCPGTAAAQNVGDEKALFDDLPMAEVEPMRDQYLYKSNHADRIAGCNVPAGSNRRVDHRRGGEFRPVGDGKHAQTAEVYR